MIRRINSFLLFLMVLAVFTSSLNAEKQLEHKIAVLVNDEVISSYDIIQRMKLTAIIQGINLNNQNNQTIVNNVVDELIQEKLKLNKINEYKINVSEREYQETEVIFFENNKIDKSNIETLLRENNINYDELKNLIIIEISWGKLIRGLFLRLTSVSELEVQDMLNKNPGITYNQAENYVIQRQLDLQSSKLLRDIMNEATVEYK